MSLACNKLEGLLLSFFHKPQWCLQHDYLKPTGVIHPLSESVVAYGGFVDRKFMEMLDLKSVEDTG